MCGDRLIIGSNTCSKQIFTRKGLLASQPRNGMLRCRSRKGAASFFMLKFVKSQTVCFTRHRIQKLPWRFNEEDKRCKAMKVTLRTDIEKAINRGYKNFLCGMALGFDMICAETVIDLKKQYSYIKIIGALPCRTQDIKWAVKDRERYRNLLKQLDDIRCIYDKYIGVECMLERIRYMVNNSSLMIALFNGLSGGTKSTIDYASKQELDVIIIKP